MGHHPSCGLTSVPFPQPLASAGQDVERGLESEPVIDREVPKLWSKCYFLVALSRPPDMTFSSPQLSAVHIMVWFIISYIIPGGDRV